jgi:CBS domain-containing protein
LTVRAITLWMLGGVTELEGEPPDAGADLRIALAGPATSAVQAGVFLGVTAAVSHAGGPAVVTAALTWLTVMNATLAVFNMLPGAPLDGGRVLRAALWRHYGDRRRAELAAARAGQFLGAGIIALGAAELLLWSLLGGLWLMLIGWFLINAANAERRFTTASSALDGVRVADVMTADPLGVHGWITVQDFIDRAAPWARQDAYPVVNVEGGLVGVVVTDLLARIPPVDRVELRLDRVALAVPDSYLAAPEDPAGPLLARRPLGGVVLAVVLAGGRIVGMVTVTNLQQATRWRSLTTTPASAS